MRKIIDTNAIYGATNKRDYEAVIELYKNTEISDISDEKIIILFADAFYERSKYKESIELYSKVINSPKYREGEIKILHTITEQWHIAS